MHQNDCKYDTLLHSSDRAGKNTFKNLDLFNFVYSAKSCIIQLDI